ncbi:hypothetical protein JXB28_01195 [Candidatus Woesearchaeota archaeon]|nr:hypothetical protein [Candidatus Woesearchaeota archaeon]
MSQAKKYFVDSKKDYEGKQEAKELADGKGSGSDGLVDKVIEGVKKNIIDGYDPKKSSAQDYKSPLPEKVTAGADDDLDELVSAPTGSRKTKKNPNAAVPGSGNPMKNSSNPLEYIAGEVLQNVRDGMVANPLDASYQIARKASGKLVHEPVSGIDVIMHEAMILGIYALINSVFKKK